MSATGMILPYAGKIYSRLMAPLGAHKVRQMSKNGLPLPFQMPLQYLFEKDLSRDDQRIVDRVEAIRNSLASSTEIFEIVSSDTKDPSRTAAQIAHQSSVTKDWGTFLYLCAKSFKAANILELGSCAGISGCYLASSNHCKTFTTVELMPRLAALAKTNLRQVSESAVVINGSIDERLDEILKSQNRSLDLVYIDGPHRYDPTLRYFQQLMPNLTKGALVVFDDIHWSPEMLEAWKLLREQNGFSDTIDVGRFGLGLWDGSTAKPRTYNLTAYTGWLRQVSHRGEMRVRFDREKL